MTMTPLRPGIVCSLRQLSMCSTAADRMVGAASVHPPAAVDGQVLPGDEAGHVGDQEQDRLGDVLRAAAMLQRLVIEQVLLVGLELAGPDLLLERGRDGA